MSLTSFRIQVVTAQQDDDELGQETYAIEADADLPFDESDLFDPSFDPDSITDDVIDEIAAVLKSESVVKTTALQNQTRKADDVADIDDDLETAPRKRKKAMRVFEDD